MLNEILRRVERERMGLVDPSAEKASRPIQEHIEAYAEHLRAAGVSDKHFSETLRRLRRIVEACRFRRPADIRPDPVNRFLNLLAEQGRSPRCRNTYLGALRAFVRWCVRSGRMPSDPLEALRPANEQKDVRRRRRALTPDEAARLLGAARRRPLERRKSLVALNGQRLDDEDRRRIGLERALIYKTMLLLGLRRGEVAGLKWADLDLEEGLLTVRASTAKSGREAVLPLPADLRADLAAWKRRNGSTGRGEAVFSVPQNLNRVLQKDLSFAGIEPVDADGRVVDVHSLRHTAATWLSTYAQAAPRTAQEAMRHSDIRLTMRTYTDPRLLDVRSALEAMPSLPLDGTDGPDMLRATGTDQSKAESVALGVAQTSGFSGHKATRSVTNGACGKVIPVEDGGALSRTSDASWHGEAQPVVLTQVDCPQRDSNPCRRLEKPVS